MGYRVVKFPDPASRQLGDLTRYRALYGAKSQSLSTTEEQKNDFVKNTFENLRDSTDFVDVTLACEDGHQIEAHFPNQFL